MLRRVLAQLWNWWKPTALVIGRVQAAVLFTLLYAVFLVPVGLVFRLFADPLQLRRANPSLWTPKTRQNDTLEQARSQF